MKPWEQDDTILARWLSDELSSEEKRAIESSEEYPEFLKMVEALSELEAPDYNELGELAKLKGRMVAEKSLPESKSFQLSTWMYVAASLALLLSFGVWKLFFDANQIEVVAQQDMHHDLPDGSFVEMSQGSKITYNEDEWLESRKVNLSGEAFFSVEKGESFEVMTDQGMVRVLGTSFNVSPNQDQLAVTCYTGSVEVSAFGESRMLKPQEHYIFKKGVDPLMLKTSTTSPGWKNKVITLKDVTVEQALNEIEVEYQVKVVGSIESSEVLSCSFPSDDLETALKQVLGPVKISFTITEGNQLVVLE